MLNATSNNLQFIWVSKFPVQIKSGKKHSSPQSKQGKGSRKYAVRILPKDAIDFFSIAVAILGFEHKVSTFAPFPLSNI